MADAFIYFRLESNNSNVEVTAVDTPQKLQTNFPSQVLQFTVPDELLEAVSMTYENNIKDAPISNPDGTRRINKQDNGLNGVTYTFRGRFRDVATDVILLKDFAVRSQVEASGVTNSLEFGIFGFFTDNTLKRPFNIEPDSTKGLTIKSFSIDRSGGVPRNFDFSVTMTFGGVFT